MSKNKGYNSIFFLMTLSVYLGLALVGAPPSVLAQQVVITQNFELPKETESNLTKKPEDETLDQYFLVRYDNALNNFVEDLKALKQRGKYKFDNDEEIIIGCHHTFCSEKVVDATSSYVASWISKEFEKFRRNLDIAHGKEYSEIPFFVENPTDLNGNALSCKEFGLEFSIDKTELKIKVSFSQNSPQTAAITAQNLNTSFSTKSLNAQKTSIKSFYQNTEAKAENEYVSVVTRLPRGSLDALVKSRKL